MTWKGIAPVVHCIEAIYQTGIKVLRQELQLHLYLQEYILLSNKYLLVTFKINKLTNKKYSDIILVKEKHFELLNR